MNYQALGFSMAACAIAIGVAFVSHKAGAYPCATYASASVCNQDVDGWAVIQQRNEINRLRNEQRNLRNELQNLRLDPTWGGY